MPRAARFRPGGTLVRVLLLTGGFVAVCGVAVAVWSAFGAGTGVAVASTLGGPTAVAGTAAASTVTVTWTAGALPSGATLSGYYVTRSNGGPAVAACASSPVSLRPAAPTSCTDSAVPGGSWRYTVVAVLNSWSAASAQSAVVVVAADTTAPTVALSLASGSGSYIALVSGSYRLYFKQNASGTASVAAAVTDSGTGPASATFPVISTAGWTHAAETVTTGTGAFPTKTYVSSPITWIFGVATPPTMVVVGRDVAGNATNQSLVLRADVTPPTGGTLNVNSVVASAAGTTSNNTTGSFSIGTLTNYTETQSTTQSGLATSTLTRETASLAAGLCGTYGATTVLTGTAPIAQSGLATGCYRYRLTGADNVGNAVVITTVVRVDTSAPVGGALTVNGAAASAGGTTSTNSSGSWTIVRTDWTDPDSGMTSSTLVRTQATIVNGACGTFGSATTIPIATTTQSLSSRTCYRYVLTGTNAYGLVSAISTTVVVGPYVTSVALVDGGGSPGKPSQGDQIVITYSDTMNPQTFCSTWSTSGNQSLTADNQVRVSLNQVAAADTVTVTAVGCTFNFGTIALGSTGYTTSTVAFVGAGANRSTATWTAATRTLTITFGAVSNPAPVGTVASSVAVYTPSTAQQNSDARPMAGTFSTAYAAQF